MRRAAGVGNWLNGAEQVIARRACQETPEALEVRVALVAVDAVGVNVGAVVVALPYFDQRAADRLAATVEDAPAQIRDRAHRGSDRVVYDQQVVVGGARHLVRVERPSSLRWR